ncbi:FhuF 2Fe-2S C-terminal domain-containing protein [Streptomyces zhaozhouensis]|uniref:FhuF 2Fe-2S C-terminal domain-containing protein n=1 Tax=Streptomyces zhaozhouensis TaxID=1300267 RepID=A0A286DZ27_9ACTN|nr:(2Fe-2S)-binding protein [Streptomyces zhaozhouensis]SOD63915.1 FhuF 2Fe-2S C-terminal domain-containing protein [Streptomyces zhaozhouensis]
MTVPAVTVTTPLTPAYARMGEVLPSLLVTEGEPRSDAGWTRGDALAEGGAALDAFLADEARASQAAYGAEARPDVVATFGLHRYAWPVAALFTVPYFLLRRVPHLAPEDVSLRRDPTRLTVRVTAFSCLPGDPLAGHPGALVASDEAALRTEVRRAAADHLGPLLDAFGPRMRRRARALWGAATDELVESLWYFGHLLGEEPRAVRELARMLPGATAPFAAGAGFRELAGPDGEALRTRDRASCCMFYTLRPADTCATCPRLCDEQRVRRLTGS